MMEHAWLMLGCVIVTGMTVATEAANMTVVEKGVSRAPIVVAANAPAATAQAAEELAGYIEKTAGARPAILKGDPATPPPHAIWVGLQPRLQTLFPGERFEFEHPEEVLIVCDGRHVAITGRDRILGGRQVEHGTANAVYTFLQDQLGVRWLWPGPLGEDVIRRDTIALAPFTHRYHPQFRQRADVLRISRKDDGRGTAHDWLRVQRCLLDSLLVPGGHAFTDWWDKYHETHPEYFALQADGTRSGYPSPKNAKICLSNPAVWAQWLDEAAQSLRENPAVTVFNAQENDSSRTGLCICERCRAWDPADGAKVNYVWAGHSREYVAMSERYIRFWNTLAGELKARFPDRADLYVAGMAYGPSKPPPVAAKVREDVIVGYVGGMPFRTDERRADEKEELRKWAAVAPNMTYRPNLWYYGGGVWGLPEIAFAKTVEDFRFLADNNCIGIFIDTAREHWATQGPQYYLMAQLAWNPYLDGDAVMRDYYERGFGAAADDVERYWTLANEADRKFKESPDFHSTGYAKIGVMRAIYDREFLEPAGRCLDQARARLAAAPRVYRDRLAHVRAGYEYVRLAFEAVPKMNLVRATLGKHYKAVREVEAIWDKIDQLAKEHPLALHRVQLRYGMTGRGGQEFFGPVPSNYRKAAEQAEAEGLDLKALTAGAEASGASVEPLPIPERFALEPAEKSGWKPVFTDDFERRELGADWTAIDGDWEIVDGELVGAGTLISARGFPGYQRMEFDAATKAESPAAFGDAAGKDAKVSDLSSLLHCATDKTAWKKGYFFQFGGYINTRNRILRAGEPVFADSKPAVRIVPNKIHHIAIENDEGILRFVVDGKLLFAGREAASLLGADHDRVGFYIYTRSRIDQVKVYTKPPKDDMMW
ncbi:MAG: DUF4838 domain-containing protein [Kiritimatiellae bacterium]|nr:DUF4838 domain-containing protein [Kiritimatiellia bacterium]